MYLILRKEDNVILEQVKRKIEQINEERKLKNLTLFEENGKQHKQINKSFDLLDADRIYKKNQLENVIHQYEYRINWVLNLYKLYFMFCTTRNTRHS